MELRHPVTMPRRNSPAVLSVVVTMLVAVEEDSRLRTKTKIRLPAFTDCEHPVAGAIPPAVFSR